MAWKLIGLLSLLEQFSNQKAWPQPDSDEKYAIWMHEVVGLIKFFERVEKQDDYDIEEHVGVFEMKSTPIDISNFSLVDEC